MKNSHLKDSLVAALIAVFAGVSTLGVNVAFGETAPAVLPANTNLVAPTFSGLNVKGDISNSDAAVNGGAVMINDNLSVSGDSTKTNALDAWGLTTIHNALDVIGITTLESNIKIGGSISNSNPGIPVNIDGPAGLKISGNNAGNAGIEIKDPDGGSVLLTSSKEGAFGKIAIIGAVAMDAVSISNLSVSSSANFFSPTLQITGNIYNSSAPGSVEQPVKIIDDLSIGNISVPANLYNLYVSGNVGLGTAPTANRLEVNGALKSTSATITGLSAGGPIVADNTGLLKIGAAASSLWDGAIAGNIYSANTGNVGIGTVNPTKKLDVNGNANISGDFSVTGQTILQDLLTVKKGINLDGGSITFSNKTYNDGTISNNNGNTIISSNDPVTPSKQSSITIHGDGTVNQVDIGTSTAKSNLTVNGDANATGEVKAATWLKTKDFQSTGALWSDGDAYFKFLDVFNEGVGDVQIQNGNLSTSGNITMGNPINDQRFLIHPRPNGNGDFLQITNDKADGSWDWNNGIIMKRGTVEGSPTTVLQVNGKVTATSIGAYDIKQSTLTDYTANSGILLKTPACDAGGQIISCDGQTYYNGSLNYDVFIGTTEANKTTNVCTVGARNGAYNVKFQATALCFYPNK